MRLVNLTPHPITLYTDDGPVTLDSDGEARVNLDREVTGRILGIPLYSVSAGAVVGLPPERDGVVYIVSSIVERYCDREDVVTVDKLKRTNQGVVLGAQALSRSA